MSRTRVKLGIFLVNRRVIDLDWKGLVRVPKACQNVHTGSGAPLLLCSMLFRPKLNLFRGGAYPTAPAARPAARLAAQFG